MVDFGFDQVSEAARIPEDTTLLAGHAFEKLMMEVVAEQAGFIYIYVSNENDQNVTAYFDDLGVEHTYGNIAVATDRYPFGLAMAGRELERIKWRYGYQGDFAEEDEETGWNSFELRMYDAVVGRFNVVDPKKVGFSLYIGMGNNPVNAVDPDGGAPLDIILRGKNGSSLTIEAAGDHVYFDVDHDFGGNLNRRFNDPNIDAAAFIDFMGAAQELLPDFQFNHVVSLININDAMNVRGVANGSWYPNYWTAGQEGLRNGELDFLSYLGQVTLNNGVPRSFLIAFGDANGGPYFMHGNVIYNWADAGNFLTGNAFSRLGISLDHALQGANVHNRIVEPGWENDSDADQRAITNGWNVGPDTSWRNR